MKPRFSARLLFAAIGLAACLLGALALEGIYTLTHTGRWVSDGETPVLLFFPHNSNETQRRLREANATSGDVEITLSWDNLNDLDLHCIDPGGHEVYYSTFYGSGDPPLTEGRLDVDRNFRPPFTIQPVEHIYWPHGRAPAGRYQVFVDHYLQRGAQDATRYQVTIKAYGKVQHYSGVISHADHQNRSPGRFIADFTVGPTNAFAGLPAAFWRALFVMGCWSAVLGGVLATGLLAGLYLFYRRVYKKRFVPFAKCLRIALFASLWSVIGGVLGQLVFYYLPAPLRNPHLSVAHLIGLILLASVVGLAVGGRTPHLRRGWAFAAGVLAGGAAGWLFLLVYSAFGESVRSEMWGRVVAAAVIGALIGYMIELVVEPPPPPPEEPVEIADLSLDGMQPLSLRANRIGPTGKLRRAGSEPVHR